MISGAFIKNVHASCENKYINKPGSSGLVWNEGSCKLWSSLGGALSGNGCLCSETEWHQSLFCSGVFRQTHQGGSLCSWVPSHTSQKNQERTQKWDFLLFYLLPTSIFNPSGVAGLNESLLSAEKCWCWVMSRDNRDACVSSPKNLLCLSSIQERLPIRCFCRNVLWEGKVGGREGRRAWGTSSFDKWLIREQRHCAKRESHSCFDLLGPCKRVLIFFCPPPFPLKRGRVYCLRGRVWATWPRSLPGFKIACERQHEMRQIAWK